MVKYGVPYDCIYDDCHSKKEKCQQCKYSILQNAEKFDDERNTSKLTFVVEKFAVHSILIIVDHILFSTDSLIECIILLERDLIDTDRVRKRIFSSILYEVSELGISRLEYLKCFFSGDRCDCRSRKSRLKFIDK
jgi:hypothetical protein